MVSFYDIFAFHNTCSLPKEQSAYTVVLLKEGCLLKCVTSAFFVRLMTYLCCFTSVCMYLTMNHNILACAHQTPQYICTYTLTKYSTFHVLTAAAHSQPARLGCQGNHNRMQLGPAHVHDMTYGMTCITVTSPHICSCSQYMYGQTYVPPFCSSSPKAQE